MKQNPGTSRRITTVMLWCGVVVLTVIGVYAAIGRGVDVTSTIITHDQRQPGLSARDERNLVQIAATLDIESGSKKYQEAEADIAFFNARFIAHPVPTFLHLVPGVLFLIFAPLQFSYRIRTRYIRFHRWSGRILLAAAVLVGLSAFFFGLLPYIGAGESIPSITFGVLFLLAATRAFIYIRRGDVAHHREWMIRMYSIAIGVSTVRVVSLVLLAIMRPRLQDLLGLSFWIGWILTLAVAELWVRRTRNRYVPVRSSALPIETSGI